MAGLVRSLRVCGLAAFGLLAIDRVHAQDYDNDGLVDVLVRDPVAPETELSDGSLVLVSQADASAIVSIDSPYETSLFGFTAAIWPDLDGGGKPDIMVTAPAAYAASDAIGRILVVRGEDYSTLLELAGPPGSMLYWDAATCDDFNGDGTLDIITSALIENASGNLEESWLLFSGATGEILGRGLLPGVVVPAVAHPPVKASVRMPTADLNEDEVIDYQDIMLLSQLSGQLVEPASKGDLVVSGQIDFNDFSAAVQSYGLSVDPLDPVYFESQAVPFGMPPMAGRLVLFICRFYGDWWWWHHQFYGNRPHSVVNGPNSTAAWICNWVGNPSCSNPDSDSLSYDRVVESGATETISFIGGGACAWEILEGEDLLSSFTVSPGLDSFTYTTIPGETGRLSVRVKFDDGCGCSKYLIARIDVTPCFSVDIIGLNSMGFGAGTLMAVTGAPVGSAVSWTVTSGNNLISPLSVLGSTASFSTLGYAGTVAIRVEVTNAVLGCVATDTHLVVIAGSPNADTDQDGISDACEGAFGWDALDPDFVGPSLDTDFDGLQDILECVLGSDPDNADSDGDGLLDGFESQAGTDPNDSDSDNDGTNDSLEDSDGDGLNNGDEAAVGSDPGNADTDNDGVNDGDEQAQGSDPTDASDGGEPYEPSELVTFRLFALRADHYVGTTIVRIGNREFRIGPSQTLDTTVQFPRGSLLAVSWHTNAIDSNGDRITRALLDSSVSLTTDDEFTLDFYGDAEDVEGEDTSVGFMGVLGVDPLSKGAQSEPEIRRVIPGAPERFRVRWQGFNERFASHVLSMGEDASEFFARFSFFTGDHGIVRYFHSNGDPMPAFSDELDIAELDLDSVWADPGQIWAIPLFGLEDRADFTSPIDHESRPVAANGWVDLYLIPAHARLSHTNGRLLECAYAQYPIPGTSASWWNQLTTMRVGGSIDVEYAAVPTFLPHIPETTAPLGLPSVQRRQPVPSDVAESALIGAEGRSSDILIRIKDQNGNPLPNIPVRVESLTGKLGILDSDIVDGPPARSPTVRRTNEEGLVAVRLIFDPEEVEFYGYERTVISEDLAVFVGDLAEQDFAMPDEVEQHQRMPGLQIREFHGNFVRITNETAHPSNSSFWWLTKGSADVDPLQLVPGYRVRIPIINELHLRVLEDNLEQQAYTVPDQIEFAGSDMLIYNYDDDVEELLEWPAEDLPLFSHDTSGWAHASLMEQNILPNLEATLEDMHARSQGGVWQGNPWGFWGSEINFVFEFESMLDAPAAPGSPWHDSAPVTVAMIAGEFALGFVPGYDIVDVVRYGIFENLDDEDYEYSNYVIAVAAAAGLVADAGYLAGPTGFATNALTSGFKVLVKHIDPDLLRAIMRLSDNGIECVQIVVEYMSKMPKPTGFSWLDVGGVKNWVLDVTVGNINRWDGYLTNTTIGASRQDVADAVKLINTHTFARVFAPEGELGAVASVAKQGRVLTQDMAVTLKNAAGAGTDIADESLDSAFSAVGKTLAEDAAHFETRWDDAVATVLEATRNGPNWNVLDGVVGPDKLIKSVEEFDVLMRLPGESLTVAQRTVLNSVRNAIPNPTVGGPVQKVMALDDTSYSPVAMIQSGNSQIAGFLGRAQDFPAGNPTSAQLVDRFRLDYQGGGISSNGPYAVLRTKVSPDMHAGLEVPRSSSFGGAYNASYPYTGNGFTAARDGTLTPEWRIPATQPRQLPAGDDLGFPVTVMEFRHADGTPYVKTIEINGVPVSSSDWKLVQTGPNDFAWMPYP